MGKTPLSKILIDGNRDRQELRNPSAGTPSPAASGRETPLPDPNHRSASLYDDTLSNRSGGRWSSLIWGFFALIVVAGVAAVFLGSSADERIIELAESKAKAADDSELSRMVAEVRDREAGTEDAPADRKLEPSQGAASAVAGSPDGTPPAAQAGKPAPPTAAPAPAAPAPRPSRQSAPAPAKAATSSTPQPVSEPKAPAAAPPEAVQPESEPPTVPETTGQSEAPAAAADAPAEAPAVDPAGAAAYEALIERSQVAAKLVVGAYPTLSYQSWRLVQQNDREVWIDLIANWTNGGSEVHFIWSVSRDGQTIRALSEAARNLERES